MNKVREVRVSRSIPDDTGIPIVDIQEHYSNAFRAVNNKARTQTATYEEMGIEGHATDQEMGIEGQYIVLLQSDTSQADLYDTINILQDANAQSSGRLIVKHIKPIKTIAKGFTATLGNRVVGLVCYDIIIYYELHYLLICFYPSVHLSIYLSFRLSIYLSIYLSFPCLHLLINVI